MIFYQIVINFKHMKKKKQFNKKCNNNQKKINKKFNNQKKNK